MMGPKQEAQAALFYELSLEDHVPPYHLLRSIARFADLRSIRAHRADFYSHKSKAGRRQYRSLKLDCQDCPSKSKCCPNTATRSINREEYEIVRDFARLCTASEFNPTAQRRRKKVEMLFAHLKRILGLGRLRLRGPCGVQDEFTLAATAQNLRKLAKLKPMVPATG